MLDPAEIARMKNSEDPDEIESFINGLPVEEQPEAMRAIMEGESMPSEMLVTLASFADAAVNTTIEELIMVANHLGMDTVPVSVLDEMLSMPKTATTVLWQQVEALGMKVTVGGVVQEAPDDISELLGEA